jgi:tight adherence protein B
VKRRASIAAFVLLALSATLASAASKPIHVTSVDTSRSPLIAISAQAPASLGAKGTPAFTVSENGQPVSGLNVSDPNTGSNIGIALDTSRSMRGTPLAQALAAARTFTVDKSTRDQFTVLSFGDVVSAASPLTTDPTSIAAALREVTLSAKQGTALYDGLLDGVRTLADAGSGRRVLIVLTDGDDISSKATAAQVIAAAHASDVTIYAIALKSSSFKPVTLRHIATATGGGLFRASTSEIKDVYATIGRDLHSTYLLQYTSSLPTKKIALTVSAPGATPASASFEASEAKAVAPPTLNGNVTRFSDTKFANLFLALAVGVVVLLGALLLFRPSSNQRLQKRIEGYAQISEKRASDREDGESRSPLFQRLLVATEGLLGRLKYWQHAGFLLQQADMPLRAAELFYIQLGIGAGLGILSMLFVGSAVLSLVLFGIGVLLPYMYVKRKAGKRTKKFESQLPDTLVAVAASLRAGHSFAQAMSTIVKDGGEPAAKEFGRVEAETRLGRSTDDALQAMAQRLASRNFEFVVLAVNIQRQVGGSLAEILDMVADTVREREQFSRKVKALTAMGRASAYVLVAMPFFIGLALAAINWTYLSPLFVTSAGHIMLVIGLVMIGIGTLILRKMVNFRY